MEPQARLEALSDPAPSVEQAAAIAAALLRFREDTRASSAVTGAPRSRWLRAARLEAVAGLADACEPWDVERVG